MVPFSAYEALVKELASLKREGFVPERELSEPAAAPELPAEIEAAITALGVDPSTERHLRKQAWELKRGGLEDVEVAARITQGEPVEL